MKYVEEYLETVVKIKPLGELTTKEDELYDLSGEMVYIDGKCSDIFISHADYANWLEKQGDRKPQGKSALEAIKEEKVDNQNCVKVVDKVEPRFKVGDWTVSNLDGKARQISEVHFDEYNYYYVVNWECVNIEEYDRLHHLWTIADAKDGDVLATDTERPFIFKGCLDKKHPNSPVAYCGINCDDCLFISNGINWWTDENVHPTTKEQRDTLKKFMADAGWEFDFDKKELKRVEQNLTWSEEDDRNLSIAIQYVFQHGYLSTVNWLKSLKERYTWKPSDEQIKICKEVYADILSAKGFDFGTVNSELSRMEEQLKKLKEE